MRILYALLFACLMFTEASAQVDLVPINSNFELSQQAKTATEKQQQSVRRFLQATQFATQRGGTIDCNPGHESGIFQDGNTIFVVSGEQIRICLDTVGLGTPGSYMSLASCTNLNFGEISIDTMTVDSAMLDTTFNCLIYHADPNVELEVDQLCVALCNADNECDTATFQIVIKRPDGLITAPTNSLLYNTETTIEVDTNNLPGYFVGATLSFCHGDELGTPTLSNNQLLYQANGFAGTDTVCVEVCDNFCVCDNFKIPITVTRESVDLPFMDDFSYDGPFPDPELWADKNTYVNTTLANDPPSIGFATFDGLDQTGTPYGDAYGEADKMTSIYFDLESFTASDDVYLSFYVQPKGFGYAPGVEDSLLLQFKNENGNWDNIDSYTGLNNADLLNVVSFDDFKLYKIESNAYFYDGFQFRFINYCRGVGNKFLWHLDYVRLTNNEVPDGIVKDMAFTTAPNFMLKNYTSMPWWQFENFESQELIENIEVGIFSHFGQTQDVQMPIATLRETTTSTDLGDYVLLDGADFNIPSKTPNLFTRTIPTPTRTSYLADLSNNFVGAEKLIFENEYSLEVPEQDATFMAILDNDKVSRETVFDNYYAHDDGTAEAGIRAQNQGTQIAVKFTTNIPDTLRAVQFHFPHTEDNTEGQVFNLKVWLDDLSEEPIYQKSFVRPHFADDSYDTIQGYTTYRLIDVETNLALPIYLPAGDFHIGWQQFSANNPAIPVGFDRNTPDAKQFNFTNTGGNWFAIDNLEGAIMVRPVVGNTTPVSTSVKPEVAKSSFSLYPNPASSFLQLSVSEGEYQDYRFEIYDAVGRLVTQAGLTPQIELDARFKNGIYFLKIINLRSQSIYHQKFIVAK